MTHCVEIEKLVIQTNMFFLKQVTTIFISASEMSIKTCDLKKISWLLLPTEGKHSCFFLSVF